MPLGYLKAQGLSLISTEDLWQCVYIVPTYIERFYTTPEKTKFVVLEAGMDKKGEIDNTEIDKNDYSTIISLILIGLLFWLGLKEGLLINLVVEAHELSVSIIYWLIGLHILAAVYHRLKNDGVWSSMVPFWKEKYRTKF